MAKTEKVGQDADMRGIEERRGVTRAEFEGEIVPAGEPVVLRGLVADWPLVAAGTEALPGLLRAGASDVAGEAWFAEPARRGRFGFAADFDAYDHERRLATVAQLLDLIERQRGAAAPYAMYAGALPVARHLPAFRATHAMPLLDERAERLVSLWLGNATRTAAHFDFPDNLACVIAGRRRFTLFPAEEAANLYIGPLDVTLAGQPSSLADVEEPDLARFPRLAEALAAGRRAELGPGDALYIPSLWWHAVASLDELGAMVNYWWRAEGLGAGPYPALLHAAAAMATLPTRERARWRALFDWFAFDARAGEHLPEGVRTGGLTEAVRVRIIRALGGRS